MTLDLQPRDLASTPDATPVAEGPRIRFDNSYARLPARFHAGQVPVPVAAPALVALNEPLARLLGIDPAELATPEGVAVLAGNAVAAGSEPIATAYAGHQFGHFVPQLGDGRAVLLGEVVGTDGIRRDIQLKGAGRTPFSRTADGRAALGPVLREYLVSEAMAALGVPTTRALAAVTTGERVRRERLLPGAILTRVATSHIRVGTFQFFAARDDQEAVRLLADHVIARHYPEAAASERPYLDLLKGVVGRQARLVAQWVLMGFVHGVMNTDNCSVAGETIDYGPCAFIDAYDPAAVFSSIDQNARYAYGRQPGIAQWNLIRLAETLLPLLDAEEEAAMALAREALDGFAPQFDAAYLGGLRAKLGLRVTREGDEALAHALLGRMAEDRADFTLSFRRLADAAEAPDGAEAFLALFQDRAATLGWLDNWRARLAEEGEPGTVLAARMRSVSPLYIPRNHLVEAALEAAVERQDFAPFHALRDVLARPFEERAGLEAYAAAPVEPDALYRTFCGT